ncbi:MAG: hypothetical protein CENE_03228 [Candidatus Celerinatantimonas neptuna]|nr:MAG: hypothetical protein CENE_03228 [Candidatus Celerinatantimonas neptuna]
MRLTKKAMLISSALIGITAIPAVAATFEVPTSFEIMYVDLHKPSFGDSFKATVDGGHHQFVVRYNQNIGRHGEVDMYRSQPIIIDMKVAKDAKLQLKGRHFYEERHASKYANHPTFTIVNSKGEKVDYQAQMLPLKQGFQPTRSYINEIKRFMGEATDGYKAPAPAPKEIAKTNEYQMMKFWYNKADKPTRKAIRIWLVDHSTHPKAENTPFKMLKFWFNKANKAQRKSFQVWLLQ